MVLRSRLIAASCLIALAGPLRLHAQEEPPVEGGQESQLLGFWKGTDTGTEKRTILCFEPGRVLRREGQDFDAFLARHESERLVLNSHGQLIVWKPALEDGKLRIERAGRGETRTYERMAEPPEQLEPEPMPLGRPRKLQRGFVRQIVRELAQRARKDQQVRRGKTDARKMRAVDRDNTTWLKETISKVGWIDADRFGVEAAGEAWLLVVHSGDLPLMLAALPEIEKDVRNRKLPDGENYANLFDRVQVWLGRRQRYGTQLIQGAGGEFLVLPLEDPDRIDAWRKEIGLQTFAESLDMHKRWTGGAEIRVQEF